MVYSQVLGGVDPYQDWLKLAGQEGAGKDGKAEKL